MATKNAATEETPELEPGGDEAAYAELEKELEGEEGLLEPSPPEPAEGEPAVKKEGEPEPKAKPSYEELEAHSKRQAAATREARDAARQANERLSGITQLIEQLRAGKQANPGSQSGAAQEEPKQPTVEEDPIGYFQAELAKRDKVIEELKTGTSQTTEQVQAQLQEQQFWGAVERSEVEMRAKTPDYDDACRHLEGARVAELEVMLPDDSARAQEIARQNGMQSPAHLRAAMLNRDRVAVAQQAFQLGMSPADLYYRLAKQRGFTGAVEPGKLNGKAPGKGNVVLDAAKRGQKAAKTISGGEGGKADNELSLNDLSELYAEDPEEFDKQWDKMARTGKLG